MWDWLARQPYVARGPRGLILHDLARDVLTAELERRSPERQRRLHRHRPRPGRGGDPGETPVPDRQHATQQLLFLHRHSPLNSTFVDAAEPWLGRRRPGHPQEDHAIGRRYRRAGSSAPRTPT